MNRLLIAAVVVIVLAVAVMFAIPGETETTDEIQRPNPMSKIDTERVTKVVLSHNVGKGDGRHKQRVVLIRGDAEGDAEPPWSLAEPVEADANQSSVKTLLRKLGELEIDDIASESAASHEDLDVDEADGIFVEVYAGDDRMASFVIGRYTSGHTMIRLGSEDTVYRARGSLRYVFGKRAADWRDKRIFDLERDQFSEVAFSNPEGTFRFTRDLGEDDAEWEIASVDALAPPPEDDDDDGADDDDAPAKAPEKRARVNTIERFDPSKVQSIVTSLARLRCTDFLDDAEGVETGLDAENADRVSFKVGRGDDAQSFELILGANHDKRSVYVRRTDRDQIYILTGHLARRLRPAVKNFQKARPGSKAAARPGGAGKAPSAEGLLEGLGGSNSKIPPEVMKQLKQQLARDKMLKGLAKHPPRDGS